MLHTYSNTPLTKKKKHNKKFNKKNHRWYVPTHACINKMILALLMLVKSTNSTPTILCPLQQFPVHLSPNDTTLVLLDACCGTQACI